MKVRDLLKEIEKCKKEYGKDFLDFDIYTEQIKDTDKKYKKKSSENNGQNWENIKDSEGWEYFMCHGYNTIFVKEKIFTINVNY